MPGAACNIRDELQKHGQAIGAANQKKADVKVACGLFRRYLATEAKMIEMLEADGASCGAPAQVIQQVRNSHAKARQIRKQVCDAAQRGPYQYDAPPIDDDKRRPFRLSRTSARAVAYAAQRALIDSPGARNRSAA